MKLPHILHQIQKAMFLRNTFFFKSVISWCLKMRPLSRPKCSLSGNLKKKHNLNIGIKPNTIHATNVRVISFYYWKAIVFSILQNIDYTSDCFLLSQDNHWVAHHFT